MSRHDRAYGVHSTSRSGGGKLSRRTRSASPYDKDARREDWRVPPGLLPVLDMPRQGGNTTKSGTVKQQPKPTTKGGSQTKQTVRRRVRSVMSDQSRAGLLGDSEKTSVVAERLKAVE